MVVLTKTNPVPNSPAKSSPGGSPFLKSLLTLFSHSAKKSSHSDEHKLGNKDHENHVKWTERLPFVKKKHYPPGLNECHQFEKDGSHESDKCSECIEVEMMLGKIANKANATDLYFEGRYELKQGKPLGKGVSGCVRLAKDVKTGQLVAVKEFSKRTKEESLEHYVERVSGEFLLARRLSHNNIVETLDIARHHHRWYHVMEYCEGGDLLHLIKKRLLCDEEVNCCFRQIAEGVRYLHVNGIAHRDLKLDNCLITSDGCIKIADFGISHFFRSDIDAETSECDLYLSCGIQGSLPYIAPEEFIPDHKYEAAPTDIWSLAIIYYALSYRCAPWKSAVMTDKAFNHFVTQGMDSIERFKRFSVGCKGLLKQILVVEPRERIDIQDIYKDFWFSRIKLCNLAMKESTNPDGDFDIETGRRYQLGLDEVAPPPLKIEPVLPLILPGAQSGPP